jgi:type III secretion system YscI/HrpB-like protein
MATIDLADLATQIGTQKKIGRIEASNATGQRFAAAMEKAEPNPSAGLQPADATSRPIPSKPVADTANDPTADAQERARRGLNLDPAHAAPQKPAHGEAILHGLQSIRGVFDTQEARLHNLLSRPAADTNTLMSMQMEVTKFSVLVDVTSKLVGKSTQALEALLKGQ